MASINITITGNIASGKTTLTQLASQHVANACHVPEPYETNPFLPLYLQDQRRWGFTSTLHYCWGYAHEYAEVVANTPCHYAFIDTGTWTNRLVYAEYLYREQFITADEFAFYGVLCDVIEKAYRYPTPDGFVFVNASPQTCWERMHRRGWTYQTTTIQRAYIETLHHYFEFMKQVVASRNIPILEIDSEALNFIQPEGQQGALRRLEGFLQRYQRPDP